MNLLCALLLGAAFVLMQALIGGTRLLFALPAVVLVGLAAALSVVSLRSRRVGPDGWCALSALGFVGFIVARAFASPVAYLAWPDLFNSTTALAVYLLTACYLTEPGRRLGILGLLLAMAIVQLLIGARQFTGGDDFMLLQWPGTILDLGRPADYRGRASGFYVCPNHLAGYLEMVGSLAFGVALWGRARVWVKLLFGYLGVVCFGGLLLTGSRGGMLGVAAALGILILGSLWRVRAMAPAAFRRTLIGTLVIGVVLAGVAGGLLTSSHLLKARVANTFSGGEPRPLLWGAAVRQFQSEPLIGTGSGTHLYFGRKFRDPRIQREPVHAHNDYLELLAEYGVLGASAFMLFLLAHLRAGVRTYRGLLGFSRGAATEGGRVGSNAAGLNLGALAAVASLIVHSVFDFNLHIPVNAMLMAFVFALLANPGRALPGDEAVKPEAGVGWKMIGLRGVLPALGICLLAAGLPRLPGEYWSEQARVALRDGHWLESVGLARRGLEVERRNPMLPFYLGEARLASAQNSPNPMVARSFLQAAVEAFTQARALFPQDIRILVRLGLALSLLDRHTEATDTLREAVAWDPASGRVHAAYAFALHRANLLPAAEEEYRRSAELLPDGQVLAGLEAVRRARAGSGSGPGG